MLLTSNTSNVLSIWNDHEMNQGSEEYKLYD